MRGLRRSRASAFMIRAGDVFRSPATQLKNYSKYEWSLLVRVTFTVFALAFSLALAFPLALAVLALAVLALTILLGSRDDSGRGKCEQQRAATNDALQEAATCCIDLIEQP